MSDSGLTFFRLFSSPHEFLATLPHDTHPTEEADSKQTHARWLRNDRTKSNTCGTLHVRHPGLSTIER